jgi:putative RNA 2'-phosphotransferase
MAKRKSKTKISQHIALLLRHDNKGYPIDSQGWMKSKHICKEVGINIQTLEEIVNNDNKTRYQFNSDKSKIRAHQGHTNKIVKIDYPIEKPPQHLYHGAPITKESIIRKEGLKPMSRHAVHLSPDYETAKIVGLRRGDCVIFEVDCIDMLYDGFEFRKAGNDVWLIDHVPADYLQSIGYEKRV